LNWDPLSVGGSRDSRKAKPFGNLGDHDEGGHLRIDWIRRYCMSMPYATESVQWSDNLVFKIGGKMFAIVALEPSKVWLSLKCSPDEFADLVERPNVVPAPYLARNHWIALETEDALSAVEIERLIRGSYELVITKLPKKIRATLC
jgi:predicted DNA-binding protein (MmcQ/YjbR family)